MNLLMEKFASFEIKQKLTYDIHQPYVFPYNEVKYIYIKY